MTTWAQSSKVINEVANSEILTPDGQQILVGSSEDEVLIYAEGYDNWSEDSKNSDSWTNRTKIT